MYELFTYNSTSLIKMKKLFVWTIALLSLGFNASAQSKLPVLIKTKSPQPTEEWLAKQHISINNKIGNIWSISVTPQQLTLLKQQSFIHSVQAPFLSGKLNSDDSTRNLIKSKQANEGYQLPRAYTGKNVIVGIIDIGFDYTHPAFRTSDGNLRIKKVWDQNKTGTTPNGFSYGTEFQNASSILAQNTDRTDYNHGTLVAGAAAGSVVKSFAGVAPEADLVLVSLKYGNDDFYSDYTIAPASILDGIKYIFDIAKAEGKPAVVNISWGHQCGPHDGSTLLDQGIEQLVDSGLHVVVAAGNEGAKLLHIEHQFNNTDTIYTVSAFQSWVYSYLNAQNLAEENMVDFWGEPNQSFSMALQLRNASGDTLIQSPFYPTNISLSGNYFIANGTDTLYYQIEVEPSNANNNKPHIWIKYKNNAHQRLKVALAIAASAGKIHGWNCGMNWNTDYGQFIPGIGSVRFPKGVMGDMNYTTGESGANCKKVITVGAFNGNLNWYNANNQLIDFTEPTFTEGQRTFFSSIGPTADGRIKPELAAPGYYVGMPHNSFMTRMPSMSLLLDFVSYNGRGYAYAMAEGTSFAAPLVSGTVALMLQVNPKLTYDEVKSILQASAVKDTFTRNTNGAPNNYFGAGKLNTLDAVALSLRTTGNHEFSISSSIHIYPNPVKDNIHLELHQGLKLVRLSLFDVQGKLWLNETNATETQKITLNANQLPKGLYFLQVETNKGVMTKKLMIE